MDRVNKCPRCGRKLFDMEARLAGEMEIKCPRCRNIISLKFKPEDGAERNESADHGLEHTKAPE